MFRSNKNTRRTTKYFLANGAHILYRCVGECMLLHMWKFAVFEKNRDRPCDSDFIFRRKEYSKTKGTTSRKKIYK